MSIATSERLHDITREMKVNINISLRKQTYYYLEHCRVNVTESDLTNHQRLKFTRYSNVTESESEAANQRDT